MLRFYLDSDKFIKSIRNSELRIKDKILERFSNYNFALRKYIFTFEYALGAHNPGNNNIRINLPLFYRYVKTESVLINRICITITHELLHKSINGEFEIGNNFEENLVDDILKTVY